MWQHWEINEQVKITKIYSFFKETFYPDYSFSGEAHNFWECVYVVSGTVCVSADERIYDMKAGEMIFHKPMELHKFHVTGNESAELIIFGFAMEGSLCRFFKDKVVDLNSGQKDIMENMISYAEKHRIELNPIEKRMTLVRMYLLPFDEVPTYSQTVADYMRLLFLSVAEEGKTFDASDSKESLTFKKAVEYMNSTICENISVKDIADFINASESSLKRLFKQYAGMGVHKYFLLLKLKWAASMIAEGLSVTEVSDKLDFSSQGYFTTVFKREMGYLPSEIKRRM